MLRADRILLACIASVFTGLAVGLFAHDPRIGGAVASALLALVLFVAIIP